MLPAVLFEVLTKGNDMLIQCDVTFMYTMVMLLILRRMAIILEIFQYCTIN